MPDMPCLKCGEPWDTHHVRNGAFDGHPDYDGRDNMPTALAALYDEWREAEAEGDVPRAERLYDDLGFAYYDTGLAHGCTSCWSDPSRADRSEEERIEFARRAIFDSAWDGDPAEFFGAW